MLVWVTDRALGFGMVILILHYVAEWVRESLCIANMCHAMASGAVFVR